MDSCEDIPSASSCAVPTQVQRPSDHAALRRSVFNCNAPWAPMVFQGAPKPASRPAGQCDTASGACICTERNAGVTSNGSSPSIQQSACNRSVNPPPWASICHVNQPGSATAAALSVPPVISICARPCQTVPLAACNCSRPWLAAATACASQAAGAPTTSPANTPIKAPAPAHQRILMAPPADATPPCPPIRWHFGATWLARQRHPPLRVPGPAIGSARPAVRPGW